MNRRAAIRHVVVISAGAILLPSCTGDDKPAMVLKNLSLTGSQEKMLAALCDAIIPDTGSLPGAAGLQSHEFVLTMIDDCTSPEDQTHFSQGMKSFEAACKEKWDTSFIKLTARQKKEWLQQVEKKTGVPAEALAFYQMTKRYTVQSFTSSKEYMTTIRDYKMIPGNIYKGCVPLV